MQSEKLLADPFWNKKMDLAIKHRDADGDGVITLNDFKVSIERYEAAGATPRQVARAREHLVPIAKTLKLTDDPSSKISFEEFKIGTAKYADNPDRRKYMEAMFDMLDVDEKGEISFDDWVLHGKCNGVDVAYARTSFEAMDTDKNGMISRKEFADFHEEYFYTTEDKYHSSLLFGPLDR